MSYFLGILVAQHDYYTITINGSHKLETLESYYIKQT